MSSKTPFNDVQQELEGLSPLLASMRKRKETEGLPSVNMDTLHSLGNAALQAVPPEAPSIEIPTSSLHVVHRKRTWMKLVAASVALMLGALLTHSIFTTNSVDTDVANHNEAISAELVANFDAETADPIAFLLDDDSYVYDNNEIMFSPVEDVLLDWADDGNVDEVLSDELMFAALK